MTNPYHVLQVTQEICIMYCNSVALQQASRKAMAVSASLWQTLAGTDYFCNPKGG